MMIGCSKCGTKFDGEKYYGICPKCGRYNRASNAAEEEHAEFHKKYDGGYTHGEQDDHQRYHDTYDGGYRHTRPETAAGGGTSSSSGSRSTSAAGGGTSSSSGSRETSADSGSAPRSTMNKRAKIVLIVFGVYFLLQFLASCWMMAF